jgi:hypothetical protein
MTSGCFLLPLFHTSSPLNFPISILCCRARVENITDNRHKIVNFEFKRKFKTIPIVSSFLGSAWNCQAQIHLESQGSDQGKMYVSRVNVKERPHASAVNATYVFLLPSFLLSFPLHPSLSILPCSPFPLHPSSPYALWSTIRLNTSQS